MEEKVREKTTERKRKREEAFEAPKEDGVAKKKRKKRKADTEDSEPKKKKKKKAKMKASVNAETT